MSRSRIDSEDLPGELEDILESDSEPQLPNFDDSGEFDPTALLSQPFFDDSNGDLHISKDEFDDMKPSQSANDMISNMNQANFQQQQQLMYISRQQQQQQHLQQKQQQQNFSFYQSGMYQAPTNQPLLNHRNNSTPSPSQDTVAHNTLSPQRRAINLKVQEVQRRIQLVQEQIERVELESNSCMINSLSSQQQQPMPIQSNFDIQTTVNSAGITRSLPGRSVSMPIRRNQMQGNPMNQPTFIIQQPMSQLHQHQAMMGNSNGSLTQGPMNNMQSFRQASNMDQLQAMMNNNSIDGSLHNDLGNNTMQGFLQGRSMDHQHAQMATASLDNSFHNAMNNSHGLNQSVSLDGSGNSAMNKRQGFNQGMDGSIHSVPNGTNNISNNMDVDSNNMMMMLLLQRQQGIDNMSSMPNMGFGDSGHDLLHNSLPQINSGNLGMIPPQGEMLSPSNYDLAQMQRTLQAQGLIPGPAGALESPIGQSGQAGQVGVNEAMEKLCESMRRSAMSRSIVKQMSGRSVSRTSSGRLLPKQQSGRGLTRQFSGCSNSGRQIARSASGRQTTGDCGLELPVRRSAQDSKHRIQRDALSTSSLHNPRRGVFRHHSQSAAMGGSNNKTIVNIDGNSIGMF